MLNIIPYPYTVNETSGSSSFCATVGISAPDCFVKAFEVFADYLVKLGIAVTEGNDILILSDDSMEKDSCRITVSNGITARAGDEHGALRAFSIIASLFTSYGRNIPNADIYDKPIENYRGLMLDTGRYFYKKSDVLKFLDVMFMLRLNTFHLHLTEDQGFRIEINRYPKLTEIGAYRSHTNFGFKPHGGYYTKDDAREIIAYAKARGITVIPEIEMPGHSVSMLASYPELGCFGRSLEVATHSGIKHDILCGGRETTYEFIYNILDEIMDIFDSKIIHLGGDEAVKTRWDICPECQKAIKEKGLGDSDGLQAYFLNRVAEYLKARGRQAMVWNFNGAEKLNNDIIIQYWADSSDIAKTAESYKGRKLIDSNNRFYFDLPYGRIPLRKTYTLFDKPNEFMGSEACLWTEYIPNLKKAVRMALPRLAAFAELVNTPKDYDSFKERYIGFENVLNTLGISGTRIKSADPCKIKGTLQNLYFARRLLHWQGLHNLIDNAKVKKLAAERLNCPENNRK